MLGSVCIQTVVPSNATATHTAQRLCRCHRCSHQHLLDEVPWQLTGLANLTRLAVAACSLTQLSPGPYLHGLRELVLFANSLE